MSDLDTLFQMLQSYDGDGAFNQYRDRDPDLGVERAAEIRRSNLRIYLEAFSAASYILVGEAAGYAGCRFSGMPFTGEIQIVGPQSMPWTQGRGFEHSSAAPKLWKERSGWIVWHAFEGRKDIVMWNTFPWHPFDDKPLSNRKPRRAEVDAGADVLRYFLSLFPNAQIYAVGRVAETTLARVGVDAHYIRHPAYGGKSEFERRVQSLPARPNPAFDGKEAHWRVQTSYLD